MRGRSAFQRMGGFDAIFVHTETASVHQQILLTYVLEADARLTYENVTAFFLDRLDLLPPLRQKTLHVPLDLHHPVWMAQPGVDAVHHFRRHAVGGAGTRFDLDALMGSIAGLPLDPAHPLWEVHYVDGLEGGQVAVIVKIHHSLADGAVVTNLLQNVADLPDGAVRPTVEPQQTSSAVPGRGRLLASGLRDYAALLVGIPALLVATVRGLLAATAYKRRTGAKVPSPILSSPRVSFNGTVTPRRELVTTDIDMARIKAIRAQHPGVTVNDVLMGVVSGVLRRWLAAHAETVGRSLVANIPVGTDQPGAERRLLGNNLSSLVATLATDVDDPTERLRAISGTMQHAKEIHHLQGATNMEGWLQVAPGGVMALTGRLMTALGLPDRLPAPFTLQVSNTPGPREPIRIGPARVAAVRTTAPLVQGNGLCVIAYSYTDRMNVTLLACPDLLGDVGVLASYIPAALADYEAAELETMAAALLPDAS